MGFSRKMKRDKKSTPVGAITLDIPLTNGERTYMTIPLKMKGGEGVDFEDFSSKWTPAHDADLIYMLTTQSGLEVDWKRGYHFEIKVFPDQETMDNQFIPYLETGYAPGAVDAYKNGEMTGEIEHAVLMDKTGPENPRRGYVLDLPGGISFSVG